jgi:hypothetical protein
MANYWTDGWKNTGQTDGRILKLKDLKTLDERMIELFTTALRRGPRINACSESPSHDLFLTRKGEKIFKHIAI